MKIDEVVQGKVKRYNRSQILLLNLFSYILPDQLMDIFSAAS